MTLVNTTNKSIRIKLGEAIAVIFFNKIDEPLNEEYSSAFPTNSHHYGQTWDKIINQDAEPFLNKKHHEKERLQQIISNYWQEHKKGILTISTIVMISTLLFNFGRVYSQFQELNSSLQEFKKDRYTINTGTTTLRIQKNEPHTYKVINVNIKSGQTPIIFAKLKDKETMGYLYATIAETNNNVITKISFDYELGHKSKDDKNIDIQWIIIL